MSQQTKKGGGGTCPQCGKPASGNFCQHCGSSLGGRFCNQCGAEVPAGARFCNQCGAPAGAGGGGAVEGGVPTARRGGGAHRAAARETFGGSNLPWWIAGAAMFVLIVVVGVTVVRPGGSGAPAGAPASGAGGSPASGPSNIDISSMTPREAADRLFNRVMTSASEGDSAAARAFVPMAVQAYDMAQPLDLDGVLHISMLQWVGGQFEEALASAEQILEEDPNHVLGLGAAAHAAEALGREQEAASYYQRVLDVYDAELARGLPEYQIHEALMEITRDEARAFLEGR